MKGGLNERRRLCGLKTLKGMRVLTLPLLESTRRNVFVMKGPRCANVAFHISAASKKNTTPKIAKEGAPKTVVIIGGVDTPCH